MEDIGRHNDVDKVIDAGLIKGLDLKSSTIVITGRISSDMVIKTLGAGIPNIASMRIANNMDIEIVKEHNINLIRRIESTEFIFYFN